MTNSTQPSPEIPESGESEARTAAVRVVVPAGAVPIGQASILTPEALDFLADLHRRFEAMSRQRLSDRRARQARFDAKELPDFRADTAAIRVGDWRVAPIPAALQDRRVEITGPVNPKMVINALNSGAKVLDSSC
jgi:malate synthase